MKKRGLVENTDVWIKAVVLIALVLFVALSLAFQQPPKEADKTEEELNGEQELDKQDNLVTRETDICSSPVKLIEGFWANPTVIKLPDGKLRMYYDCEGSGEECKFLDRGIHSSMSYGGRKWTRESSRRLTSGKHPFIFESTNYKLYFVDDESSVIRVVASYDGINFESNESAGDLSPRSMIGLVIGERIIGKDTGSLDTKAIGKPSIVATGEGYRMYYVETKDNGESSILSAFSYFGSAWEKEEGERIDSSLFEGKVDGPEIVKHQDKFMLYFSSKGGIYRAFSDDGLTFETPRLVLEEEDGKAPSNPSIMKSGNNWIIYYNVHGEGIYSADCSE